MVKKILTILYFLLLFCIGYIAGKANIYNTYYSVGVSWNRGGLDIKPEVALYLCDASYNPLTQVLEHYTYEWEWLNNLIVEC